jgi:hypothetical protein
MKLTILENKEKIIEPKEKDIPSFPMFMVSITRKELGQLVAGYALSENNMNFLLIKVED